MSKVFSERSFLSKSAMAMFRKAIYLQIFEQEGLFFTKVFNLANKLYLKWPIEVKYRKKDGLYTVSDIGRNYVVIGRNARVPFYKDGVEKRLERLARKYFLDDILFEKGNIIVDVGANVGEVSLHLAQRYDVNLVCIEPEDLEFRCLQANCNKYNSIFINLPLWSEEKTMIFYQKNNTGDSSLFETSDYAATKSVKATTLSRVLLEKVPSSGRVRLLKLEAEGAEPEILLGGLEVLDRIDYISADVGPERGLNQESTSEDVKQILLLNGFELVRNGSSRQVLLFKNSAL